jgi:general stress protein YciG
MDGQPQSIEPDEKGKKPSKAHLFDSERAREAGKKGGRPRKTEVEYQLEAEARKHASAAVDTLVSVMNNTKAPAPARVTAANSILDRAYGKAKSHEDDGKNAPVQINIIRYDANDHAPQPLEAEAVSVQTLALS